MKTIKTRLISTLLVVMTLLSLLPTMAFAATGTGKGITITTNQVYWSTRILANGTPYSYRPPEAAGRLLYCLDSGLGYHNATPSYCDSYTYTSATNADADAVLKTAVANSGLGEMDAATLANVKWLMTYINDSKASNIGQLFTASCTTRSICSPATRPAHASFRSWPCRTTVKSWRGSCFAPPISLRRRTPPHGTPSTTVIPL